jgi:alanyl aminopeptidase
MLRAVLVVAAATVLACSSSSAPRTPAPPVAADPLPAPDPNAAPPRPADVVAGVRLPKTFRPVKSRVRLAIDPDQPRFTGAVEIDGTLAEASTRIWLNSRGLTIKSAVARAGGRDIALTAAQRGEERISLDAAEPVPAGQLTLALEYDGKLDETETTGAFRQKSADAWYVFTQLEAIYARRVFPSVDEPDAKIPWQVTLDVPGAQVALSNTTPAGEEALPNGWKRIRFAETRPMPSYLVAFAVGPFELVSAGKSASGVPLRIVTPKGRAKDAAVAAEITPRVLAALEQWFGTPYPYDKLDSIAIPVTVGFGAMENAGLITYNESLLLIDPADPSLARRNLYASIAAHEIGHQWFGNLVTLAWWDDIWLNEAFATWITDKVMATTYPAWGSTLAPIETRATAAWADSLATARQIRQPIESDDDIDTAFDGITYKKGASILHMFERWVGPDRFRDGVRSYLQRHAWGNATSADFVKAISEVAGVDAWPAFSTFLDRPGLPRLAAELHCSGKSATVTLEQSRYLPEGASVKSDETSPWQVPVCVAHGKGGKRTTSCALVQGARAEVPLEGAACPDWFYPNADGSGYYRSGLPSDALKSLTGGGWKQLTPAEKAALFGDVLAATNRGDLPITAALEMVPLLVKEDSRFLVEPALRLVESMESHVPADRQAAWRAWIVKALGPEARRRGWTRRGGDTLDAEQIRPALAALVADAGEPRLRKDAIALAKHWRTMPSSLRQHVLAVAVDDPGVFNALIAAAPAEKDRKVRRDLVQSLGHTRDPGRLRQALGLMLDERLDARDTEYMDDGVEFRPASRDIAEAFLREHLKQLLARWPHQTASRHAEQFTRVCDPARRGAIAAFVTDTFSAMPGGPRRVSQSIEKMDQCIARGARYQPVLTAWLANKP